MGTDEAAPAPALRRIRNWSVGPDGRCVGVLIALPALLLVVPALFGHPSITSDNAIQNFPLRVLSGRQLVAGHLPLWNPYIWSGSPLLGGLNAGSFYPATLLFALFAPVAAWVLNLLAVYWAGGLGLYALARQYGLRPVGALAGALVYAFGGAMVGQVVHLGVVEGMGWMPLLVLAEVRLSWAVLRTGPVLPISRSERTGSPWAWVGFLALLVGLEALTGEPRAMAETEVVGTFVALWLVARPYGGTVGWLRRAAYLGATVLGALWGAALAAAELAPGWSFIRASQRAVESYWFFGTGSLRPRATALMFLPDLFGGSGAFGQPGYFNAYNLPEVTGYVGLLAVGAAFVLITRSFGRRRSPLSSDWGVFLGLALFGLLLSWGSGTPLGHLFAHIPLFGKTRLQSRNLAILDLGLAVALAFFADRALERPAEAGLLGWRRAVAVVPAVCSAALCVGVLAVPVGLEHWFGVTAAGASEARQLWPWFAGQLAVCCGVVAVIAGWRSLGRTGRQRALIGLVVADLALFVLATSTLVHPPSETVEPTASQAAAVFGHDGRFAIYDTTANYVHTLTAIGQPDLNAFTGLASVQGYGSILSESYGAATGAHSLDNLTPCDLARGVFVPLRLATLITLPTFLAPAVPAGQSPVPVARCPGAPAPGTATTRTLYIGRTLEVRRATLIVVSSLSESVAAGATVAAPTVTVLSASGRARHVPETATWTGKGWRVRFNRPVAAAALMVRGPARSVLDTSTVTGVATGVVGRWAFDGVLQNALGQSSWRLSGTWGPYARFSAKSVRPPVWLAGPGARSGSTHQVSTTEWGTEVDRVVAVRSVTLVRSEAYLAGWRAELAPAGGGAVRTESVEPRGLIQSVRVPPGRWTVTFVYRPPHLSVGIGLSAVALLALAAVAVVLALGRRRVGSVTR